VRAVRFGALGDAVPIIGQGTWNLERAREIDACAALRAGLDAGMTHIDTAELYGGGRVESIVGQAIEGRRDDVFLVSKVLPSNAAYKDTLRACERSLDRLRTDRLDVYLLHWRGGTPLEETFRAFDALQQAGKIRAFGVSNFDVRDIEDALRITGPGRLVCNQVLYHLGQRGIEHELVPHCADRDIAVVAYSPFGSGHFPGPTSAGGRVLARIAANRHSSPYQVALAFLIAQGGVLPIPKSAQRAHTRDNAAAAELELEAAEIAAIDAAFPRGRPRRLAML
jgi:diketogulonate reductase-like aldo/keto reductase